MKLQPAGQTAAGHLARLLADAQRLGTDLKPTHVSFRSSDLGQLTNQDLDLLMNQFVVGSGNDGAAVLMMGTEEAFFKDGDDLDRSSLALGQCAFVLYASIYMLLPLAIRFDLARFVSLHVPEVPFGSGKA